MNGRDRTLRQSPPIGAILAGGVLFLGACSDPNASGTVRTKPTAPPTSVSLPAHSDPIVQEWSRHNSECRGGSFPDNRAACERREQLTPEVEARGWCYARGPEGGFDWLRCSEVLAVDRSERDHRRKLDMASSPSSDPSPSNLDQRWFVAAPKYEKCEELRVSIGVSTPDEVVTLFANNNMPLQYTRRDEDLVLVRQAGNPLDPGMAFVRGMENCEATLMYLDAMGR